MSTIGMVLNGVLLLNCIALIVIVLLQSKRSAGLGAVGTTGSEDSYWNKNKSNSVEGALEKYTKMLGASFVIVALLVNLLG